MEISRSKYIPQIQQENSINSCEDVHISDQSDVAHWINFESLPCYKYIEVRYHRMICGYGLDYIDRRPDPSNEYEVQVICANQLHWKINKNREIRLEFIENTHEMDELLATENRLRIQSEKDEKIKEDKEEKEEKEYRKLIKNIYKESYKLVNIPIMQTETSDKYGKYHDLIKRTKELKVIIREKQTQLKEINFERLDLIFRIKELKKSDYLNNNNIRITKQELKEYKSNQSNCVVCKISIIQQNSKCEKYRNPKDYLTYFFLYLMNYELCFECFNHRYFIYCFLCNVFTEYGRENEDYRRCIKCTEITNQDGFIGSNHEKHWKPGAATSDDKSEALVHFESRIRYKNRYNNYRNS